MKEKEEQECSQERKLAPGMGLADNNAGGVGCVGTEGVWDVALSREAEAA